MLQGCQLLLVYWGLRYLLIYLKSQLLGSGDYTSILFSFFKNVSIFYDWRRKLETWKIWRQIKRSQKYCGKLGEGLGFQLSERLLHLSHAFEGGLWILDSEYAEYAVLEWENAIKQLKIHVLQTDQMFLRRNKLNNPPTFTLLPNCETSPLCR